MSKRFKVMRKYYNFTCWKCGRNYFYSPDYSSEHCECQECRERKDSLILAIARFIFRVKR